MRLVINIVYGGRYIKLIHSTRLTNIYESTIHPTVRRVPPIGVIMPKDLLDVKNYLLTNQKNIINEADYIAAQISNKMPFIYAFEEFEGVIMPNDLLDVKAIIIRLEEKINTPERNSQPT